MNIFSIYFLLAADDEYDGYYAIMKELFEELELEDMGKKSIIASIGNQDHSSIMFLALLGLPNH